MAGDPESVTIATASKRLGDPRPRPDAPAASD
jgi:hypothetical protein